MFGADKITTFELTRAISAYERTLISGNSPFDRFYYQGNEHALNDEELLGWELFQSERLNCTACHSGFNFTNESYQCNGLYTDYPDNGRLRITHDSSDLALFKVPSLRNVALTAPYMHDGSLNTLEEVLDHYAAGGQHHPNQSQHVHGFELKPEEKQAVLSFLRALTDSSFVAEHLADEVF